MSQEMLWDEAVAATRDKSPGTFDQWFSGVQFDGLSDGILSLRARDEFVREWVDDFFLPTLTDHIRTHTGWSVQVAWTVDSSLDSPVIDQPSAPPVRPRALTTRVSSSLPPRSNVASNADLSGGASDEFRHLDASEADSAAPPARALRAVAPPIDGLNPKYT